MPITIVDVTVLEPGVFALVRANSNADCGVYAGGILVQGDCRGFQVPPANAAHQESTSCGVTVRAMSAQPSATGPRCPSLSGLVTVRIGRLAALDRQFPVFAALEQALAEA